MVKTERRRNQYAGSCKVCSTPVEPGAGWLYSDTHSNHGRSRHRARGTWPKFVKCDRCHTLGAAHKIDLPENKPVPSPTIGVKVLRQGRFRLGWWVRSLSGWRNPVVELVLPDGTAEIIAQQRPITGEPIDVGDACLEGRPCFGGRVLTHGAGQEIVRLGEIAAALYGDTWLADPREFE